MLSQRLPELRRAAGLSQRDLASRLGVSKQAVSAWETGHHEPSLALLGKLADLFACTTDSLLGRTLTGYWIPTEQLSDHQAQLIFALVRELERKNEETA